MIEINRRNFLHSIAMLAAAQALPLSYFKFGHLGAKLKVALVGTGVRGTSFWGKRLVDEYSEILEFVGLSDINPGRLAYGKEYIGADCPTFLDCDEMLKTTKPDLLIVTTKDSTHDEYIIMGLNAGIDVLTEKPMTTDEDKCQRILDAEKASNAKLIVGFNYRWSPYATKIKSLLSDNVIGKITSVDFHWYLNTYHGASYFRRWHGLREAGGTLWVHKATHHFDLLNWWLDSDPEEVFAYGDLEHYGSANAFRGEKCRKCDLKDSCKFYYDITQSERNMALYVNHEEHDGYIRDNCLFRKEIDIYDKMSAQIKYMNNVVVNYSLTTYSPFEGYRIAFNGMDGRIEAWQDIPYNDDQALSQSELHDAEMSQAGEGNLVVKPIIVHKNWNDYKVANVQYDRGGHGGGDQRLQDKLIKNPDAPDPLRHMATVRDGAMSILIGIAARKSIESSGPIKISTLTDLDPQVKRG